MKLNPGIQGVTHGCNVTPQPGGRTLCVQGNQVAAYSLVWSRLLPSSFIPPRCGCPPAAGSQLDEGRGWPEPRTPWCHSFPIWLHLHTAGQAAGPHSQRPSHHPGAGAGTGIESLFSPCEPCLPLCHPQQETQAATGSAVPPRQGTRPPGASASCGLRLGCT